MTTADAATDPAVRTADRGLQTQTERYSARLGTRTSAVVLRDKVLAKELDSVRAAAERLGSDAAVLAAAAILVGARRRFVLGEGKSRAYAALLAADLGSGLSNVTQIDDHVVQAVDLLADVRETDVLVCFSFRRYRRAVVAIAEAFEREGGTVVLVTDDAESPAAAGAAVVIAVDTESESYADSPVAVALVCQLLSTLTIASAKGAKRRLRLRDELVDRLGLDVGDRTTATEGTTA